MENVKEIITNELTTLHVNKIKLGTLVEHSTGISAGYYDCYDKDDYWIGTSIQKVNAISKVIKSYKKQTS